MTRSTHSARAWLFGFLFVATVSIEHGALSATACKENAYIVFDGSSSMAQDGERVGVARIVTARKAISDILPDVTRHRPTGLITYGGTRLARNTDPGCTDIKVRVPVRINSAKDIIAELETLVPDGKTPLSHTVLLATEDLARRGEPGIVVAITDGLENCLFNPCELGLALKEKGYPIQVHVISFFVGHVPQNLACLPALTGGTYAETNSLETLRAALRRILGCLSVSQLRPW